MEGAEWCCAEPLWYTWASQDTPRDTEGRANLSLYYRHYSVSVIYYCDSTKTKNNDCKYVKYVVIMVKIYSAIYTVKNQLL